MRELSQNHDGSCTSVILTQSPVLHVIPLIIHWKNCRFTRECCPEGIEVSCCMALMRHSDPCPVQSRHYYPAAENSLYVALHCGYWENSDPQAWEQRSLERKVTRTPITGGRDMMLNCLNEAARCPQPHGVLIYH